MDRERPLIVLCVGDVVAGELISQRRPPGTAKTVSLIGGQGSQKDNSRFHGTKVVNLNSDCQVYVTLVICRFIQVFIYKNLNVFKLFGLESN